MKCGDTCRHNISKVKPGLSVKLLQLPLKGEKFIVFSALCFCFSCCLLLL